MVQLQSVTAGMRKARRRRDFGVPRISKHESSTIPVKPTTAKLLKTSALAAEEAARLLDSYGEMVLKGRTAGQGFSVRLEMQKDGRLRIERVATEAAAEPAAADAFAAARARGAARIAEILADENMLSADAFGELVGATRATINNWRQKREVLGLEGAKRGVRYPRWQLGADGRPFAALPALFEKLGDSNWAVYRFLVQQHAELGGLSGREALARGQTNEVLEAADSVARDFA